MNAQSMPRWLMVLLGIVALFVLGPPLLAVLFGAVGLLIGLTGALLKLGVVALVGYGAWRLLRALFGGDAPVQRLPVATATGTSSQIDDLAFSLEREERARKAELDRELERAVAQSKSNGGATGSTAP